METDLIALVTLREGLFVEDTVNLVNIDIDFFVISDIGKYNIRSRKLLFTLKGGVSN